MASREEILGKIHQALQNGKTQPVLPDPPQVWPMAGLSAEEMASAFQKNLTAAAGEVVLCKNRDDAMAKMADILASIPLNAGVEGKETAFRWGIQPGEMTLDFSQKLEAQFADRLAQDGKKLERVFAPENADQTAPRDFETLSASLVAAEYLLTDTGSAVIRAGNAFSRLLCYLSPACLILAKRSLLREHLPHAWPEIMKRIAGKSEATGEFLLMTGPSRTADIEKILILGVHGPKKVVVFILEDE